MVKAKKSGASRNAELTKSRILSSARKEFSTYGYAGARVDRIGKNVQSTVLMVYYYFKDKDDIYLKSLESFYLDIREAENQLNLDTVPPIKAIGALIDFTFDYFLNHPEFISIVNNENLLKGQFVKKSKIIHETAAPLLSRIGSIMERGQMAGLFRQNIDPGHLYMSITALSRLHVSTRYTMSALFKLDLSDSDWLQERRAHVHDMILHYILAPDAA